VGYLHIDNLYAQQDILLFKRCYALEKIDGTSADIKWKENKLEYFYGSGSEANFEKLFDAAKLTQLFVDFARAEVTIYGEFYGGSLRKRSNVYGKDQRFIAFDVQIDGMWLAVPNMTEVCAYFGVDVVPWVEISTDVDAINTERDKPSVQATRNGVVGDRPREGVILRPLIEVIKNNGNRVIAKHKRDDFAERATPQKVEDPTKLKVLADAKAIADEWVVPERLRHVLDKLPSPETLSMERVREVIAAMQEDVKREASKEIVWGREAESAISKKTVQLFKEELHKP
jgi:hypothetical protein